MFYINSAPQFRFKVDMKCLLQLFNFNYHLYQNKTK